MNGLSGAMPMAAISFQLSYWIGPTCLQGLVRILTYRSESDPRVREENCHVLSSQP
jgi:hypothetical protein